jgi:GTP-binding protein
MSPIIAIVGRPNVGKSTLFNRLSRSRGALVDNRPGVTRDRLYTTASHEGVSFILVDTGGFEDLGTDPLLNKVQSQVKMAIEEADRVIFMVDGRQGVLPGDEEMAHILRQSRKKIFLAVNKIDGEEHDHLRLDFYKFGMDPAYPISAAHGYGVKSLMNDLVTGLHRAETDEQDADQIRVSILGRPNVGKSSLINRILGSERLVVSALPGTTRDSVDTRFSFGGKDYLLIDTAGIRRKARVREKIEKFSVLKALKSLERCHVAVILLDAAEGVSEQDARIAGFALERGRGLVLAVNKWDLLKGEVQKRASLENAIERQLRFISFAPRINISALTGERVMKLFNKINIVYEQFATRVSTASLNRALREIIDTHPPPVVGRGRFKLSYATQVRSRPPTFVLFVNKPTAVHFSYARFLTNQIKSRFRIKETPVKLVFREKGRRKA